MTTTQNPTHYCEANGGRCDNPATVDFGRYLRAVGVVGEVRYLCCHHARGLKGHRPCQACGAGVAR